MHFKKNDNLTSIKFLIPAFIIMLLVHIIPIFIGIYISFINLNMKTFSKFLLAPVVGFKNYYNIFHNKLITGYEFLYSLRNIVIFGSVVIFFTFVISALVSSFFNKKFRGKTIYLAILLIPYFTMDSVAYSIWRYIFSSNNGTLNNFLMQMNFIEKPIIWFVGARALIPIMTATIWKTWPFFAVVMHAGYKTIPKELYEQAKIDGANWFRQYINISLPIMWPLMRTLLIISTIWIIHSYNNFFIMLGRGTTNSTIIPPIAILRQLNISFNYSIASSMSMILLALTLFFTILIFIKKKEVR